MSPAGTTAVHASCVLVGAAGVLLRGRPGCGKSSLALSLLACDGPRLAVRLVADDCVRLRPAAGRLVAEPPAPIAGLIEIRGAGLMPCACEPRAVVRLVVDVVPQGSEQRLPEPPAARAELCGIVLPRLDLCADSALAGRVIAILEHLAAGGELPAEPGEVVDVARIRA